MATASCTGRRTRHNVVECSSRVRATANDHRVRVCARVTLHHSGRRQCNSYMDVHVQTVLALHSEPPISGHFEIHYTSCAPIFVPNTASVVEHKCTYVGGQVVRPTLHATVHVRVAHQSVANNQHSTHHILVPIITLQEHDSIHIDCIPTVCACTDILLNACCRRC